MNINGTIVNSTQQTNQNSQVGASQNTLGKEAFLKILVTQLKNQNPTEPLKDTEFIAQMAQFSSLEQLTNLNTSIHQLIGLTESNLISQYANLIGTNVSYEYEINEQLVSGEGLVKALTLKNGEVIVELEGDTSIPIYSIQKIAK